MIYLISLYLLFYFFLAWRRLDWAVLIIIAALPSYLIRFSILGIPLTLLETMILISFTVWFIANFNELKANLANLFKRQVEKRKVAYPFRYEIILMLIISYLVAAFSGFSDSALGIWKAYFFEPILLFIIIINIFKASDIGKIIWAFLISALAVSLAAIYQKITGYFIFNEFWAASETRRVTSFFGYPNAVGLYLGPLILIFFGWLADAVSEVKWNKKIFNFPQHRQAKRGGQFSIFKQFSITNYQFPKIILISLTIMLSILSIYFAKSVGALVGIGAGLIVFGLLAGRKTRLITIALVLSVAIAVSFYQPFRQTAYKYLTLNNFSGQIRKLQWRETWKILKDGRMITGAGLANYQKSVAPYHQEGFFYNKNNDPDFHKKIAFNADYRKKVWQPLEVYLYPHNIFLNFWSELGLAGMLLFIWIFIKFYYLGFKILIGNCHRLGGVPLRREKLEIGNLQTITGRYFVLGLLGAMTVIIIHGLVDVPYFKNDLAVMFWVLVAMLGIIDLEAKKSKV